MHDIPLKEAGFCQLTSKDTVNYVFKAKQEIHEEVDPSVVVNSQTLKYF